jgi:hypothetical protein
MSILLPAIGKARLQAQGTRTRASMNSISAAIERYYNDHRAYPGVIPNAKLTLPLSGTGGYRPTPTVPNVNDNIGAPLTMTENLVLTLCGGFTYRQNNNGEPIDPGIAFNDIGKGPLNLSALPMKRVRSAPYIDASPGTLFPRSWDPKHPAQGMVNTTDHNPLEMPGEAKAITDSYVPEFVDAYSDPRPLLYMRAVVGGKVVPDRRPLQPPDNEEYDLDTEQYNIAHVTLPYRRYKLDDFMGDFTTYADDPTDYETTYQYLRHPSIADSPRGKDKYLLIGAGPDRRYGTVDDVLVGG